MTLAAWHRAITEAVEWLGPVPLTVLAMRRADHPWLDEIIRFAHRLECTTELSTDGTGIDLYRAEELVDRGLAAARIWVGGLSEASHRAVVGGGLSGATGAVAALVAARKDRGASLDIEVAIPWQSPVESEVRGILGWAREAGADGFRIVAPWRAERIPTDPELLDALADEARPFNRTPAAAFEELHAMVASQDGLPGFPKDRARLRRFGCPVGGQRLEITESGLLRCCPFKDPIGVLGEELRESWSQAGPHLQAIASCERACAHIELCPRPIFE